MKPIGACIFVVSFLMIFASLVRFYVFVMPPGGSKMLAVDVSIRPYQWLGRSPSYHEVLTPAQLLPRLQNHHHHTQAATTTTPQKSLAMDQEEKKQVQSIRDQLKGHSLPDGGEILGSINLSSSEFTATNSRAHIVRQYESGSTASERKTTRETPDRKGSSTQPSASQQVEIVERILLSLSDFAATIDNSPYEPIIYPRFFCCDARKQPIPAPPPKALEKPKVSQLVERILLGDLAASIDGIPIANIPHCTKKPPAPAPPPKAPEKPKVPKKRKLAEGKERVTLENLQQYFGHKRKDVAASLGVSVSTFKRMCRLQGITRWRNQMGSSGSVSILPNRHGERSTSTACETPSHNVQTGMVGELVGQNEVANVFQRDFMGGPIALNTESGLIMVSRPPGQHGERNTSTACRTPSCNVETGMEVEPVGQNQEANVFRRDFMGGPIALNTDGLTFPECSDAIAPSQPMATILDMIPHLNGGSSECAFQVKNQSTQFTANPYPNGLVDPHPQIALTQILSENMERLEDRRNLFAPQKVPLPEGHVFGSVNWTVRSCSDLALSQPMPTIPHATECSEYWRNSLALLEEHLLEENDYGSINSTTPSCFDPGPSQPMHTIPHTMPTIPQMMPLLTERQDMRSVRLKATYGNTTIKFPLPSGFSELKEEVSKRLEFERGSFKLEYKDEDGDSVLIACDEDLRDYLQLLTSLGNQVVKLFVLDKVPKITNFCDNCRSLKCKRT